MVDAGDIGTGLRISCYLFEGTVTKLSGARSPNGTEADIYTFSAPITTGSVVQIYTGSVGANEGKIVVENDSRDDLDDEGATMTAATLSSAIGIVVSKPTKFPSWGLTASETLTVATYSDMRAATVEFPGYTTVRQFTISGSAKAGTLVGWDTSEGDFSPAVGAGAMKQGVLLSTASTGATVSVMM